MDGAILSSKTDSLRQRWQHTDIANYDAMTEQMCNYLASLDEPLLSICHGHVLELASGTGRMLAKIRAQANVSMVVGLDMVKQMLHAAAIKGHQNLIQGYAESLPLASDSFDTVICTFYSFRDMDRRAAYYEIARVLRAGGAFGFTLRNYYVAYLESLWRHFLRQGHWPQSLLTLDGADGVMLDLKDIKLELAHIKSAGLKVREIKTLRFLPFLRRFLPAGYWSGEFATKLGSDIIIVVEK